MTPAGHAESFGYLCALEGTVVDGKGEGRNFVSLPWARDEFREKLRMDPFPGTLNVRVEGGGLDRIKKQLENKAIAIVPPDDEAACRAFALPAIIEGKYRAFVIVPEVEGYYENVIELISEEELRPRLAARPGGRTRVRVGLSPDLAAERRIEGIIIDMDGTLINTLDLFFSSIMAALSEEERSSLSLHEVKDLLDAGSNLREILLKAGVKEEERIGQCTEKMKKEFRSRKKDEVKVLEKASEAMSLLRQIGGLKVGLATGSTAPRSGIELDLKRMGLFGFFDSVTTGVEVEKNKPSPDLIINAAMKLGVDPRRVLVVGDATMDIIAGRTAGCRTAAVLTGVGSRERLETARPDMVMCDLFELTERIILEGLA